MKNIELLLDTVTESNHFNLDMKTIHIKTRIFSGNEIYKILEGIKWANSHFPNNEFLISIKSRRFASYDVVTVTELIMLYLAINYPHLWRVRFEDQTMVDSNILFRDSLLQKNNGLALGKQYITAFYSQKITLEHYRAVISLEDFLKDNKSISSYCDDIYLFLKHANINESLCGDLFEACSEIIGNVFDHTETDCIVDIKCSPTSIGSTFFSVSIISLSNVFIGTRIIELLDANKLSSYSGSNIVTKAYEYHSKRFNSLYDKNMFGFVCAFQNGVSTRENSKNSGGTGLTTLIKRIHGKKTTDEYNSYVLSGRNTLKLDNNYLNVNKNGLIGFNDENDFYGGVPKDSIIFIEPHVFPGTIFSISLLL